MGVILAIKKTYAKQVKLLIYISNLELSFYVIPYSVILKSGCFSVLSLCPSESAN